MNGSRPEFVVFYAWQSDRPRSRNKDFVHGAALEAAKQLSDEAEYSLRIDQDTQGVPGLCDIPATILAKIDAADGFLCDLTYVAQSTVDDDADTDFEPRYCSNPNVLFELGYAFRVLGPARVVCVMNEHYGPVEEQIFDIAHRRHPVKYECPHPKRTRKEAMAKLATDLVDAFRGLLPQGCRSEKHAQNAAGLKRVGELMDEGRRLVQTMKSAFGGKADVAPARPPPHDFKDTAKAWESQVKDAISSFCPPSEIDRFVAVEGRELDWPEYPDILDNSLKTVASCLDRRIKFLSDEILKPYGASSRSVQG